MPAHRPIALSSHHRAVLLTDGELLAAWDGLGCSSTHRELAGALRLLGREHLAAAEEANIEELRDLHSAVWEEIVARGLVERTPPESRYEDNDPADGGAEAVGRREYLALVG